MHLWTTKTSCARVLCRSFCLKCHILWLKKRLRRLGGAASIGRFLSLDLSSVTWVLFVDAFYIFHTTHTYCTHCFTLKKIPIMDLCVTTPLILESTSLLHKILEDRKMGHGKSSAFGLLAPSCFTSTSFSSSLQNAAYTVICVVCAKCDLFTAQFERLQVWLQVHLLRTNVIYSAAASACTI